MDEEFRKPYEYEEEKKGFLLLFVIMILVTVILQTLSFISRFYDAYQQVPVLRNVLMILGILCILFTIFTAILCFTLNKQLVAISKLYLIIQAVFSIVCYLLLFIDRVRNEQLVGTGQAQYKSFGEMLSWELLFPITYIAVFTVAWYLYFIKSKRCKEITNASKRH